MKRKIRNALQNNKHRRRKMRRRREIRGRRDSKWEFRQELMFLGGHVADNGSNWREIRRRRRMGVKVREWKQKEKERYNSDDDHIKWKSAQKEEVKHKRATWASRCGRGDNNTTMRALHFYKMWEGASERETLRGFKKRDCVKMKRENTFH